ncbi:hypothetical protein [Streptomyces sp. NPDC045470]|uniref:hypothetical protein n=1 Tax=Streptomyces sp. NPDC045470 TaxID=3155469 RepID=UPI00340AE831
MSVVIEASGARHNLTWPEQDGRLVGNPELPVIATTLKDGPRATLEHILHVATHALCYVRGISETSNRGQRHNKRFREMAGELGMQWPKGDPPHGVKGFSPVPLAHGTLEALQPLLACLADALTEVGSLVTAEPVKGRSGARLNLVCACGRKMQMGRRVFDQGPVLCGVCKKPFSEVKAP